MEPNNTNQNSNWQPPQATPTPTGKGNPLAILCYLGILLIIPWIIAKDDPFIKYHVKQGLTLLVFGLIAALVSVVPVLGWIVGGVLWIISVILALMGIINALTGKQQELPLIGQYAKHWNF